MHTESIIQKIAEEVRSRLSGEGSGHDWWHVYRVWKMAQRIAQEENVDRFIVESAALLHDIADWKFHGGDDSVGPRVAGEILQSHGVGSEIIAQVGRIIQEGSFKGAGVSSTPSTREGMVVQDADRLDAIGAIGIARTFAFGGHKNRAMYDPAVKPVLHQSKDEYAKNQSPIVNHFYEKLLLLKDLMNTPTARAIAKERHAYMETFLERFFSEWEGKA